MVCIHSNKKTSFKIKFVYRLLMIAVVIGFGTIAFTASTDNSRKQQNSGQISYFDPFQLETIYLNLPENEANPIILSSLGASSQVYGSTGLQSTTVGSTGSTGILRPPVRIPYRPPFRSPFRPPWIPGPPSWWPGDPPWTPGPPPWQP